MSKQSFYNHRFVHKTRKDHICEGCGYKINAGRSANIVSGVFEGDFFSSYLCTLCNNFLEENPFYFQDGWSTGDIGEARREQGDWKIR